jgi:hypothetical protein
VLDESRKIYAVKDVAAVPLSGVQQAESVTNAVARRKATRARGSLVVSPSREQLSDPGFQPDEARPHVKFSDDHQVKVITPEAVDEFSLVDRSPSPVSVASSVASSVSSEVSRAPVANALAKRLSFWSTLSRKNSLKVSEDESHSDAEEEAPPLDALIHEGMPEPQQVLSEIIKTAAPPPPTMKDKYSELEAKILRQTIKEYAKGEMYFAYDFGEGYVPVQP